MTFPSSLSADPWASTAAALQAMQSGTLSPDIFQGLIDALCQLHLGGLASRFVGGINATGEYTALKDKWLSQSRSAPSGKVAWASRKRRFAANLSALAGGSADLAPLTSFWETAQNRYELYIAADHNVLVFDTQNPSPFSAVLGGLRDHISESSQWTFQKSGQQFVMPIAFNGAGYGWLLNRILETTAQSYLSYSCPVYIVEPDSAAICVLLHAQDLRFAAARLRIFAGENAVDHFESALRQNTTWSLPGVFASAQLTMRQASPLEKIRETINAGRQAHLQRLKKQADDYYDSLPGDYWRNRFADAIAGKARLKILGLTTRYSTVLQYSMQELGAAIQAAGHEYEVCIESDDQSLERFDLDLIVRHKPDLIVQISRMRYENPWLPRRVPFLCWDQDNLPCLRTPEATASLDQLTYVAGPGANIGFATLHWPRRNCIFVQPAGQWHRYAGKQIDPALLQRHEADFAFISNASTPPEEMYAQSRKAFAQDSAFAGSLDQAAHEVLSRSAQGGLWSLNLITELVRSHFPGLDADSKAFHEASFALQHLADRTFRHVTLNWVADYCRNTGRTLKLYGNGWEKTPGLSEYAAGVAVPGDQVLAIYRATRINLQIIESGFLHSRLLDGIAAGGFFLSRQSLTDYRGTPEQDAIFKITDWLRTHPVESSQQLIESTDPIVREYLPLAQKHIQSGGCSDALLENLIIHDHYRPVQWLAPELRQIEFASRDQFLRLADQYLNNESHRLKIVASVNQIMKEHFSYDTRLRQFLSGIHVGLSALS